MVEFRFCTFGRIAIQGTLCSQCIVFGGTWCLFVPLLVTLTLITWVRLVCQVCPVWWLFPPFQTITSCGVMFLISYYLLKLLLVGLSIHGRFLSKSVFLQCFPNGDVKFHHTLFIYLLASIHKKKRSLISHLFIYISVDAWILTF